MNNRSRAGIVQRWLRGPASVGRALFVRAGAPRPFDLSRPLAFMHIPKTAGTSLVAALIQALEPRALISGLDGVLFGDFDSFSSFQDDLRSHIYLSPEAMPVNADLITGHIGYTSLRQRFPDAQLITVLREPFCRILSHWLFWRGNTDEVLVAWGSWADRVRLSHQPLANFLSTPTLACQIDNLAVRMLLSPHPLIPVADFIDPKHDRQVLTEAHDRLGQFSRVDVVENPKLSSRLKKWLGRPFDIERRNETEGIPEPLRRPLVSELTSEAVDLLAARSRLDLELWRAVTRRQVRRRNPEQVRLQALLQCTARYSLLMGVPSLTR